MSHTTSPVETCGSALSGETMVSCSPWHYAESCSSLIYAVLSGSLSQIQALAIENTRVPKGDTCVPEGDAWVIFEACIQGPNIIHALSSCLDFNQQMPGQLGDRAIHLLLRTAPSRFLQSKRDTISALLQVGVNPLESDRWGNNALHILAGLSDENSADGIGIMELILSEDIRELATVRSECLIHIDSRNAPQAESEEGDTPLVVAVLNNHLQCVQLLLNHGANPQLKGGLGQTPLTLAVSNGYFDVANALCRWTGTSG